jgi:hypothetical protein
LKDPLVAAVLAWFVPGLGHLYQGRIAKAILFFVCLMSTFAYGCYLGGNAEVGYARVVYYSWSWEDPEQRRLPFVCQAGMGWVVLPAIVQAGRIDNGQAPYLQGFMAPPIPGDGMQPDFKVRAAEGRANLDELSYSLRNFFELGTVFTMIAGLLNILAVCDAWGGPVFGDGKQDEDEDDEAVEGDDVGGQR